MNYKSRIDYKPYINILDNTICFLEGVSGFLKHILVGNVIENDKNIISKELLPLFHLIKKYEGLKLETYLCPSNVLTIGYGHTGEDVYIGKVITKEEADILLYNDVMPRLEFILENVDVSLNLNQTMALTSFVYNIGSGAFSESTLLKKLNEGKYDEVPEQLRRWKYGNNGEILEGLIRRREDEIRMWLGEYYID